MPEVTRPYSRAREEWRSSRLSQRARLSSLIRPASQEVSWRRASARLVIQPLRGPFPWAHAVTSQTDDPSRRAVSLPARGSKMPPHCSSSVFTFASKWAWQTHRDWMARIATSSWLRLDCSTLRGGSWGRDSRLGKKGWMRQRQPPLGPADDSRREKSEVRVSCFSVTLMHGCAETHRCQ